MIIKKPIQYAIIIDRQGDYGVFDTMDDAIKLAYEASEEYSKYNLSRKNEIVEAIIKKLEDNLEDLSLMTCKETGTDSYDDILYTNTIALNNYKNDKYLEAKLAAINKVNNLENSYIVNGIVVPSSSNPIEIIIKNSILMLEAGHSVVFSSNEEVKHVFAHAVKLINKAMEAIDGPKNIIATVKEPSIENTNTMIKSKKITLVSAIDNHDAEKIAL